jgi:hypothetical protein
MDAMTNCWDPKELARLSDEVKRVKHTNYVGQDEFGRSWLFNESDKPFSGPYDTLDEAQTVLDGKARSREN